MTQVPYETIYHDFNSKLRKFVYSRVSNWDITEDILQDVYIKLHNNIDGLSDIDHITAWLYKVTRNTIIDQHRRSKSISDLADHLIAPPLESPDLYTELASSVHRMLDCLDYEDRQALLLADIHGLKQKDVATQLGLSYSGAKSRIQRARSKLRKAFLDCCHFEFDHMGIVMDYQSNCYNCANKEEQSNCAEETC